MVTLYARLLETASHPVPEVFDLVFEDESRERCVDAVNAFAAAHGLEPVMTGSEPLPGLWRPCLTLRNYAAFVDAVENGW